MAVYHGRCWNQSRARKAGAKRQEGPRLAPGKVQKASPSGCPFRNLTSLQAVSFEGPLKLQGTCCWASEKESASQKLNARGAVQALFSGDRSGTTVTNNHLHSD